MKTQTRLFMTLSPEGDDNTNLTYNEGIVTAIISFDRKMKITGADAFYLYNDELALMDMGKMGDSSMERSGRTLKLTFCQPLVWLPGGYFLLLHYNTGEVFRFDIVLDDKGHFVTKEPRRCGYMSIEHLLSNRLCERAGMWSMLSSRPGMGQFKQKAIERARIEEMNHFRSQLVSIDGVTSNNNFIVYSQNYRWISQAVTLFCRLSRIEGDVKWIDCSTLYDPTCNNPYEKLNELFAGETSSDNYLQTALPKGTPRTYCLENISALMDSGGKVILKKLRRHWTNVILTGSRTEVDNLLEQYPSLRDLFPADNYISIEPFTASEVIHWLFFRSVRNYRLFFSPDAKDRMCRLITEAHQRGTISHWTLDDIDKYLEQHVRPHYCQRLTASIESGGIDMTDIKVKPDDIDEAPLLTPTASYAAILSELDGMIGLTDIKQNLTTIANNMHLSQERRQLGLHTSGKTSHHAIFMGNPGTGKTTVARLLGKIYHSLGLLSRGDVICVDRTRIIGRYIGETEENMKQILQEAQGNVLLVDEAYTLYSNSSCNDFGLRAVECLLSVLTQKNPDMLIIFAGYQEEMDRLMSMNPGLPGRFPYKFLFKDYSADELMQIARKRLECDEYQLTDEAAQLLLQTIKESVAQKNKNFGNARWVEQYVESGIIPALGNRLATTAHPFTREVYQRIEAADVRVAYEKFNPKTIELKPRRQVGFSA